MFFYKICNLTEVFSDKIILDKKKLVKVCFNKIFVDRFFSIKIFPFDLYCGRNFFRVENFMINLFSIKDF